MPASRALPAALVLAALLAGCEAGAPDRTAPGAPSETAAAAPPPVRIDLEHAIHPDLPPFTFTLRGVAGAGGGPVEVAAIEVSRGGDPEPFQVLDAGGAELPLEELPHRVQFVDMDFDGHDDLRMVEHLPAGADVAWRHWLYDPASGRFEHSPALDGVTAAVFDREARRVRSDWRDGAARYGSDHYAWRGAALVLERRETREYSEPGIYRLTVEERRGAEMVETESRTVREDLPG